MKQANNINEVIKGFEESAVQHTLATDIGDYKVANKNYKSMVKAVDYLKNWKSLNILTPLLKHSNLGVRLWSATFLLSVNEDCAIQTLQELSHGNGITSFNAQITLREWQAGRLKI